MIGFVVPVTLAAVFSFTNGEKVVVLATWVVWILLIMGFLMVIEYMRDNLNRQVELGHLSDESIQSMLVERQAARIRRKSGRNRNGGTDCCAKRENAPAANARHPIIAIPASSKKRRKT